ncbi:MAG: hypothetical protein JW895_00440 [Thermoleophilaceae bacterium]|nr:hypothetical protein [Thermoleophilaceae bacterium]
MSPPRSSQPPERPPRRPRSPHASLLRLEQLAPGRTRGIRLPLLEAGEETRAPTGFFLELRVTCDEPGHGYHFDVKADFGSIPPRRAVLTVLKSRNETLPPEELIERGVPVERGFALAVEPATDRIVFWVATEGAACVPEKLAAALRVRSPADEPAATQPEPEPPADDDDLDTMRLPTRKLAVKVDLTEALRRSASPPLALLGEVMHADELDDKLGLLRGLVASGADLRLVETAVQDVALSEHMVPGFARVPFERLDVSDGVHACVVVFHPAVPPHLVRQCLVVAVERACLPGAAQEKYDWPRLARAAALVLARRARAELDAEVLATRLEADARRLAFVEELVAWAGSKRPSPAPRLSVPVAACLELVGGDDAEAAERAAYELLAHCGFVAISGDLG